MTNGLPPRISPAQYLTMIESELKALYPGTDQDKVFIVRGDLHKNEDLSLTVFISRRVPSRQLIQIPGEKNFYQLEVEVQLEIYIEKKKFTEDSIEDVLGRIEYYVQREQTAGVPINLPTITFGGLDQQNRALRYSMSWTQRLAQEEYHEAPQLVLITQFNNEVIGEAGEINPFTLTVKQEEEDA